ncbi:hypothetical protein [Sutcliffiella sp. BMC8]|uniref:hypothetical protein n=1 Tax=Sutcliffiella sp. BMC8 TaxID=3073243 RepID=UPI0030D39E30
MNAIKRQTALNCLNKMEVIESEGGESAYALVENNEDNRKLLKEAGIPLETALRYGDNETFCIIALACGESYANWYDGTKLYYYSKPQFKVCLHKKGAHTLERKDGYWTLNGEEIDQEHAISELVEAVQDLGYWCQVAKDVLSKEDFEMVQEAYAYEES